MRNISFQLTTAQVRDQTKTVTRRLGWKALTPGTLLQPVEKGMGLKKGEKVVKIGGPIRVLKANSIPLSYLSLDDVRKEGFPKMTRAEFVRMFRTAHKLPTDSDPEVRRIEFEYL